VKACNLSDLDYFTALCERRAASVVISFRSVLFKSGETPAHNECHKNVAKWVEENFQHKPIRGWLDLGSLLEAHSVVADADCAIFDITPSRAPGLRFLRHIGTETEFWALLPRNNQVHLVHYGLALF
jgi:hypothetical protein